MIPSVKVAGHRYKIRLVGGEHTPNHGQCDTGALLISLTRGEASRMRETLIHEIGHAIYYEYDVESCADEECRVSRLSTGWHQVLVDNPKLILHIIDPKTLVKVVTAFVRE